MAEDKKRDFTGFIIVGGFILLVAGIWWMLDHSIKHGTEQIESYYVHRHEQDITDETRDRLINAVLAKYAVDSVCFDNSAGVFLFHVPDHPPEDNQLDGGWYMVSSYTFIQLQNKSYVIETFGNQVDIRPDLTGIYCKQQEIKIN